MDEGDLPRAQCVEEPPDVGGLQARLEIVEQDVIGVIGRRKERHVPLLQIDHLLQVRPEQREVRSGARLRPRVLRGRDDGRMLGDEVRGHARRLVVVARGDPHPPHGVGIGILAGRLPRTRLDRGADLPGREFLVGQSPERGAHLAVDGDPAIGHIDPLVPLDEIGGVSEVHDLANQALEMRDR